MKIFSKTAAKIVIVLLLLTLTGCEFFQSQQQSALVNYNYDELELPQLNPPGEDQPKAVVTTDLGTFVMVLYPEYAPNTVANFVARVKEGFYESKPVFAVEEGKYFLTGAANEAGTSGLTSDGKPIPNECTVKLWPFKGAVLSFFGEQGYGDSRFFGVGGVPFGEEEAKQLREIKNSDGSQQVPEELITAFLTHENVAGLAGWYTVFGQIVEGMDVLDALINIPADDKFKPLEPVLIQKIELVNID